VELAADSESEAESVYSYQVSLRIVCCPGVNLLELCQSKETVPVKDSSDDYWFLDDEEDEDEADGISFRLHPEGAVELEFRSEEMEEYELDSISSHAASDADDVGSDSPEEEIRVTIQSEDFGFWADSESSDAEEDASEEEFQDTVSRNF
jgi:hypothetical protein